MSSRGVQPPGGSPRGFTLIELMVTVLLIALLAALSVPTINRITQRADARSTARAIANKMRVARDQAMSRGEVVLMEIQPQVGTNGERGQLTMFRTTNFALHCGEADTAQVDQVGQDLHVEELSDDMEIKDAPDWICFSPEGTVVDATGALLTSTCPSSAGMIWLGRIGPSIQEAANELGVGAADLTDCSANRTATLMDARYLASVWGIEVPFNGSIRAYQ